MIGGLQGDFGDLDIKYLKKNIPKYLKMSVKNIRKLQENTAAVHSCYTDGCEMDPTDHKCLTRQAARRI